MGCSSTLKLLLFLPFLIPFWFSVFFSLSSVIIWFYNPFLLRLILLLLCFIFSSFRAPSNVLITPLSFWPSPCPPRFFLVNPLLFLRPHRFRFILTLFFFISFNVSHTPSPPSPRQPFPNWVEHHRERVGGFYLLWWWSMWRAEQLTQQGHVSFLWLIQGQPNETTSYSMTICLPPDEQSWTILNCTV